MFFFIFSTEMIIYDATNRAGFEQKKIKCKFFTETRTSWLHIQSVTIPESHSVPLGSTKLEFQSLKQQKSLICKRAVAILRQ